jgi:hypothetical protein
MALEAMFTIIFHACTAMTTDIYVHELLLWPRTAVEWKPFCSHLPLNEAIRGGLSMSAAELELVAAIRKARAKDTNNIKSQRFRAKLRAEDLAGYQSKFHQAEDVLEC